VIITLVSVVLGGVLGGVARYFISGFVARRVGETFPWGTLFINVSGAFLIGIFGALAEDRASILASPDPWLFAVTGFLGCYTTVSSFSLQTLALARDGEGGDGIDHSKVQQGFDIAPVPLDLTGKNRDLVGMGSYIVNANGGCLECHTNPPYLPGGDPFLGQPKKVNTDCYLTGGMQFGPFTSRNLTPENGLPEGHTFAEFVTIMRTGKDFDLKHPQISPLLQVMPWPVFQNLTDRDLQAIYEYLSAIPAPKPGANCTIVK